MASMARTLAHNNADKLVINIPSKIVNNVVAYNPSGDAYADSICSYYEKLASSFEKIASECKKVANSSAIASDSIKSDLDKLYKKANNQSAACKRRKSEIKQNYNLTADIFNSLR